MNRCSDPTTSARPLRSLGRHAWLLVAAAVSLGGCATIHKNEANFTSNFLGRAGFTVLTDQGATKRRLASMPPLKMVKQEKDGQPVYSYADPYACGCVYVGDATAYATYRKLVQEHYLDTIESVSLSD